MKKKIEIKKKKPILAYDGMDKKTLVEAVPTQVVEVVYPKKAAVLKKDEQENKLNKLFEEGQLRTGKVKKGKDLPKNRLIWTNDNLVALKTLLDEKDPVSGEYKYRNKVDLIYIDPPFMVQDDFVAQNTIDIDIDKEEDIVSVKEPTIIETIVYKDTWQNGLDSFLQMMRERLLLMKDLLASNGSIYVHLDWHTVHYIKVLMDEIFDYPNFGASIVWKKATKTTSFNNYGSEHDTILFYALKKETVYFNQGFRDLAEDQIRKNYVYVELNDGSYVRLNKKQIDGLEPIPSGRRFRTIPITNMNQDRPNLRFEFMGHVKVWAKSKSKLEQDLKKGLIIQTGKDTIPVKKQYLDENLGVKINDFWADIPPIQGGADENYNFPTQKPKGLLQRIISISCSQNGLILDAFMGSGTTCEAAERLSSELNCSWIGIDNSKFAIHTARKRLIELNVKPKGKKTEGVYKVRPFTVENMGYYQRGVKWDSIQTSKEADAYRQAIIELFGGEYAPYSKLLHGKKRGTWIHVGPLSQPLIVEQVLAIAEEVKESEFKKCYVLSADFTAHLNKAVEEAREKFGVQITTRIIPASAIEEVKKRLELIKQGVKDPEKVGEMPNLAFFAPLTVKINKVVDCKEVMIELAGLEVDAESFLESQKPERKDELKKWLEKEKSWQSFVDFWAIDWDYENLKDELKEPIFENEWQSFRKRKGKKVIEDLVFKAFHTYENPGEYTIAVKVTDVFGNDGIVTAKVVVKK
jgi:adenine-specific DNA-methyltransferase